jgi:hypothetical protein
MTASSVAITLDGSPALCDDVFERSWVWIGTACAGAQFVVELGLSCCDVHVFDSAASVRTEGER